MPAEITPARLRAAIERVEKLAVRQIPCANCDYTLANHDGWGSTCGDYVANERMTDLIAQLLRASLGPLKAIALIAEQCSDKSGLSPLSLEMLESARPFVEAAEKLEVGNG